MPQTISLSISIISPPVLSPVNLITNLYQVTKLQPQRLLAVIVFEITLLQILDLQICKGLLLENCKEQ